MKQAPNSLSHAKHYKCMNFSMNKNQPYSVEKVLIYFQISIFEPLETAGSCRITLQHGL